MDSYNEPPNWLKPFLSSYGEQLFDYCGESIGWGYKILSYVGEDGWRQEIEKCNYGHPVCISTGKWVLITKFLSRLEAEQLYGLVTNEQFGPMGGWKSITFGSKEFRNERFKSKFIGLPYQHKAEKKKQKGG